MLMIGDSYNNNGLNGDAMLYRSWNRVDFFIFTEDNLLSHSITKLLIDIKEKADFGSVDINVIETRKVSDIILSMLNKHSPSIIIIDFDTVFFAEKIRVYERFNAVHGCFKTIVLCNEKEYSNFNALYGALFDKVLRKKDVVASYYSSFISELNSLLYSQSLNNYGGEGESYKHRFFTLTPREGVILRRIMSGMSNAQIANELYISIKTVSTHRSNIYDKLNVKTVGELYNLLIRESLIDSNVINLSLQQV